LWLEALYKEVPHEVDMNIRVIAPGLFFDNQINTEPATASTTPAILDIFGETG